MNKIRNRKKKNRYLLYAIVLLLSIGYAAFSTTLKIQGEFGILSTNVKVEWQNPVLTKGSVAGEVNIDQETKTIASFSARLQNPGDFYEFTIDAINSGNVDAMINLVDTRFYTMTSGEEVDIDLPDYINYSFTYSDGVNIQRYYSLKRNSIETYKIRIEMRKDINPEDLPQEPISIGTEVSTEYKYADKHAQDRPTRYYMVTFDPGEGTVSPTSRKVNFEETIGELPTPTRENYVFDGWHLTSPTGVDVDQEYIPTNDVTLYANWIPSGVVAEINGSYYNTLQAAINAVPTTNTETTIRLLANINEEVTIAANKNVVLNIRNFTISNNSTNSVMTNNGTLKISNGTINSTKAEKLITNNGTLSITGGNIKSSNNTIYNNGGNITITGGTIVSNSLQAIDHSSGTLTIGNKDGIINSKTPIIQGNTYGITATGNFKLYDGIIKGRTEAVDDDSKITEIEDDATQRNETESISGVTYKTLFIKFSNKIIITFNANGGTVSETTRIIEKDDPIGQLPTPTRNNYSFLGWYTLAGDGIQVSASTVPDDDVEYFAHWADNTEIMSIALLKEGPVINDMIDRMVEEKGYAPHNNVNYIKNATIEKYNSVKDTLTDDNLISLTTTPSRYNADDFYEDYEYNGRGECNYRQCATNYAVETGNVKAQPVYMWYDDSDNTIYYYSDQDKIYLNPNSSDLFWGLESLTEIDLSKFDTSRVTNMNNMFRSIGISSLDVSNFDTRNVTSMAGMFYHNPNLTKLDLSSFDTSKVTNMAGMFGYHYIPNYSLTSLDISNFDTRNVTNMGTDNDLEIYAGMFGGCTELESLDISHFNTSKVTNMRKMFYYCNSLTSLDLSNFNTSKVTDMSDMFADSEVASLDLSNFDTSKVTDMSRMFDDCNNLTKLDVSSFNTSNVTDMSYMFRKTAVKSLDLSNFDTSKVTDMSAMFYGSSYLESLDLSSFNTNNVEAMVYYNDYFVYNPEALGMFEECSNLETLDISNFNTSKIKNMSDMFRNCSKLKTIYAQNDFNRSNVEEKTDELGSKNMFYGDTQLVGGAGKAYETTFNSSKTNKEYAQIANSTHPGYFTQRDTSTTYKIKFNANGGTTSPVYKIINIGDPIGTLPTAEYGINEFDGWYTDIQTGIKVDSTYVPSGNITLTANWNLYDGWYFENQDTWDSSTQSLTDQKWKYYDNGKLIESGLRYLNGRYHTSGTSMHNFLFENGYMYMGWYEKYGNKYYFSTFDANNNGYVEGYRFENTTKTIDGVSYTFDADGVCTNCGWYFENKNQFDSTGQPVKNQKWTYTENGVKVQEGLRYINGSYDGLTVTEHWHLFHNGYMYMGWYEDSNGYRYFFDDTAGARGYARGYRLENKTKTINGVSYTFDSNGRCTTNCEKAKNVLVES